jgi:ABC-type lipoprotein export system ATPase subunit
MPIRQQKLNSIDFEELKSLKNIKITFTPNNVTGIFGVNGSGKSSIIHTLLSLYKPSDQDAQRKNFKFSEFFTPTTHTRWVGSKFMIDYSYRDGINEFLNQTREYSKQDRWRPKYDRRPEREVYFVGISSCVPDIEVEKKDGMINLVTHQQNGPNALRIREKASFILNRNYQEYNRHESNHTSRKYIGLRAQNINYSSLNMGAGEQRVFKILETVFNAPDSSLIVIDEIDLTLHTDALNRLLDVLVERANQKNLQIVFTSHREELTKRTDINIRHIYQTGTATLCFNETNPDCLTRLTGTPVRPLEIFVEDDLGETIARKVTEELQITRHCAIKRFGAADNSFTLGAGMFLKGEDLENISIFIDGDKYRTAAEMDTQMKKYFSGNEQNAVDRRSAALSCIRQFSLPPDVSPEQFINNALQQLNDGSEVCNAANAIQAVNDRHQYVDGMINALGYDDKMLGLNKIVDKLATTPVWAGYTQNLQDWLNARVQALHLN